MSFALVKRAVSNGRIYGKYIPIAATLSNRTRDFTNSRKYAFITTAALGGFLFLNTNIRNKSGFCYNAAGSKVKLGEIKDFKQGEMYEIQVHDGKDKVLLSYVDGTFYCTGNTCPHFGAPLIKGIASNNRVICPWHYAEFDLKTGKCVNGPTINPIPQYPVTVENDTVYAEIPASIEEKGVVTYAKYDPKKDKRVFAIVGGGVAAVSAADTLRAEGFSGKIIIFSEESYPPYDRVILSKNLKCELDNILLRPKEFYKDTLDAELYLNESVKRVDLDTQTIYTAAGNSHKFDRVVICTGSRARQFHDIKGSDLSGIYYLRSMKNVEAIRARLTEGRNDFKNEKCVVIGSSFIGLEIASALKKMGVKSVTVVGKENVPFEYILGKRVGGTFLDILKSNDINFVPETSVKEFIGSKNAVTGVKLSNGETLAADHIFVGIGSTPALPDISCKVSDAFNSKAASGGVQCDPFLKVPSYPNTFVAGDIAAFPYVKTGEYHRIEHYACAMQQGRVAALNMLDKHKPYVDIPFFWTLIFGKSLRYVGVGRGYTDVIIEGDIKKCEFVAYYINGERVIAVATMGKDPVAIAAGEAIRLNMMPTASELRMGIKNSNDIIQSVKNNAIKVISPKA